MKLKDILAGALIAALLLIVMVGCEVQVYSECMRDGHSWIYCERLLNR